MTITVTVSDANVPNLLQSLGYGASAQDQVSFIQQKIGEHLLRCLNGYAMAKSVNAASPVPSLKVI